MTSLQALTDWKELERLLECRPEPGRRSVVEREMAEALTDRVKGQDHVIGDLCRLVRLQWAKQSRKRPVCNLLLVGPTGTGKTELSKALADYLYGGESALLRFDCSELAGPEAKNHLLGNPRGYAGDTEGGKLTRPMINNPRRIVLFDEVEKAYPPVMDLFLQLMGEGRLTEPASGAVADFSQAIVILTSNAESEAIGRLSGELSDPEELRNAVKTHLAATTCFRPEAVGRLDRVYVFRPLEGIVIAEIVAQRMWNAAREYGLELEYVDARLILEAMQRGNKLSRFGVRELERVVNDMLGESFVSARERNCRRVRLGVDASGEFFVEAAELR